MFRFGQLKKTHKAPVVLFHRSSRISGQSKRIRLSKRLNTDVAISKKTPNVSLPPRIFFWFEAAICYLIIFVILRFVHPNRIADIIISNSYLPLHLLVFIGNLSLMIALSRSWLIGVLFSFGTETLLYFKLLQIQLEWKISLVIMLPWLIFLGFSLYNNRRRAI